MRVIETVVVVVDGISVEVEHLEDGTFRRPLYLRAAERQVVGTKRGVRGADGTGHEKAMPGKAVGVKQVACAVPVTASASPDAELWDGWGTALKPAWEPVIVGRKPA